MSDLWRELLEEPEEQTDRSYLGTYEGERGEPQVFFNDFNRKTFKIERDEDGMEARTESPISDSDVISSELPDGMHAPVIDLDLPIRAIPSSTPDNWHLYIEKAMTWEQYLALLWAFVEAGLVEQGYYEASKARGGTHVRLPWVKKPKAKTECKFGTITFD